MTQGHQIVLNVSGMSCGACERRVRAALAKLEGVEQVDVALADGRVRVSSRALSPAEIITAIEAAGYPATLDSSVG